MIFIHYFDSSINTKLMDIKEKLKELYPKRTDRAKFLGVKANDCDRKVKTYTNKIEWLKKHLKPLGLILEIKEDE